MPEKLNKRIISLQEVRQHNKSDDVWMILNDKVYCLTDFLNEHPGGMEPLTENAGRDATKEFIEVGHSQEAEELMKKYYIGDLDEADKKKEKFLQKHGKDIGIGIAAVVAGFLTVYLIKRILSSRQ